MILFCDYETKNPPSLHDIDVFSYILEVQESPRNKIPFSFPSTTSCSWPTLYVPSTDHHAEDLPWIFHVENAMATASDNWLYFIGKIIKYKSQVKMDLRFPWWKFWTPWKLQHRLSQSRDRNVAEAIARLTRLQLHSGLFCNDVIPIDPTLPRKEILEQLAERVPWETWIFGGMCVCVRGFLVWLICGKGKFLTKKTSDRFFYVWYICIYTLTRFTAIKAG